MESPSTNIVTSGNGKSVGIQLSASTTVPHESCVIRNCYIDGGETGTLTKPIRGIMADGGRGTIVEGNKILNCMYGGPFYDEITLASPDSSKTVDLIVRENYYRNVLKGIYFYLSNDGANPANPVGRIILLQNQFELTTASANPAAIFLDCTDDDTAFLCYQNVIARGNRIRPLDGGAPASGTLGIKVLSVGNLTIDNNWVDVGTADNAVQRGAANKVQVFNNRDLAGAFLPVKILNTSTHQGELTTDAELMFATL